MTSVLRARALGETRGFMKMLLAADSDRILGFTMLGADAGEVLGVVQTAMLAGLPYTGLRDAILTHPTMAEGINVLLAPWRAGKARAGACKRRRVERHDNERLRGWLRAPVSQPCARIRAVEALRRTSGTHARGGPSRGAGLRRAVEPHA